MNAYISNSQAYQKSTMNSYIISAIESYKALIQAASPPVATVSIDTSQITLGCKI